MTPRRAAVATEAPTRESAFIRQVLARHGARPDMRLWRNEVGVYWAGKVRGRTADGALVLEHATRVSAGLAVGSSDLIGIGPGGQFVAIELKTPGVVVEPHQLRFVEVIRSLGGLAGVARSVDDVDQLLGVP